MIDLHSHILWGIDDGAADIDESLELAKIYARAGYRQVVATPHALVDSLPSESYGETIRKLVIQLNRLFSEHAVPLKVLPGMEVGLDINLPKMVAQGTILTLADQKYLLVETPFHQLPMNWLEIVFSLANQGISVLLAHPERCIAVAHQPAILDQMAKSGIKFQVNWDSFSGTYGKQVAKVAVTMARKGLIHCLATDSHDPKVRHAGHVPGLTEQLIRLVGQDNFESIAVENPARVVEGRVLKDMDLQNLPNPVGKKKTWALGRFMSKLLRA